MKLDLKAVSYKKCKQYHMDVNPVFETQLCAIGESGKGACHVSIGLRYWIETTCYFFIFNASLRHEGHLMLSDHCRRWTMDICSTK